MSCEYCLECGQELPETKVTLEYGPWVVYYPQGVTLYSKEINLNRYQFRIFERLFRNKVKYGRDTSHEELGAYMYPDEAPNWKSLKVMMVTLRKKLPPRTIIGMYAFGYVLNLDEDSPEENIHAATD
jgi:DNA-binding response OmpR family regulator